MFDTNIATKSSIAEKVRVYNEAQETIRQGYALLAEAQQKLKAAFSVGDRFDSDFDVVPHDRFYGDLNETAKKVEETTRRKAWRQIYQALDIDRILSIKRAEEIHKKLDEGELPEVTIQNIYEVFETLVQNTSHFAEESVREVYEWLRPREGGFGSKYKTNPKFEIGKRVILSFCVSNKWGGGFQVDYYREKNLLALDRVFHMLDGKSILKEGSYRSPLVDAINTCGTGGFGETDYFRFKCYQNQNLHVEFKCPELVKQFNQIAGGLNLKPSN